MCAQKILVQGERRGTLVSQCGAIGEIRTPDLLITNQLLCRLSYNSISEGFARGLAPLLVIL